MSPIEDVQTYEKWLRDHCTVVEDGLRKKHRRMARSPFLFFRATCFRFARTLPNLLPELRGAPAVPSVGDAHADNWGTWRDAEGRLVWGVNDFDEAAALPYAFDLLRLATSTLLANGQGGAWNEQVKQILAGYRDGLDDPRARIVDGTENWMRLLLERSESGFGTAKDAQEEEISPKEVPGEVMAALRDNLPPGVRRVRFTTRQRGGGSLGRPRYLASGTWRGGTVTREAKALVPSAWDWAAGRPGPVGQFLVLATGRYRSPDPYLAISAGYVIRRIAPDSEKIDLTEAAQRAVDGPVLAAMGADLAAIHLSGRVRPDVIKKDLRRRKPDWLDGAARIAARAVTEDFDVWHRHWKKDH